MASNSMNAEVCEKKSCLRYPLRKETISQVATTFLYFSIVLLFLFPITCFYYINRQCALREALAELTKLPSWLILRFQTRYILNFLLKVLSVLFKVLWEFWVTIFVQSKVEKAREKMKTRLNIIQFYID